MFGISWTELGKKEDTCSPTGKIIRHAFDIPIIKI
jgi:hypothetical protein